MNPDAVDRLRLVRAEGVGPITYRRLLERFRTPAAALSALPDLARNGGRSQPPRVPSQADAAREIEQTEAFGARLVFLGDPDYPISLANIDNAPAAFTLRGDPAALAAPCIALVGARNASTNGKHMAELLAYDLASHGLVVVSGLARGIDTAAHTGALRAGRTIAAIAGGIDVAYPPENAALQDRVAAGGALVAEAPFGTTPQARHFPRRNRIIAGLSLGVIVVEAAPRSGSLITARLAAEMGRDLFAVPGSPLDPRCRGSNDLLRSGAHLVENASDVLANLPPLDAPADPPAAGRPPPPPMRPHEADRVRAIILEHLSHDPTNIDELVRTCGLATSDVTAALLELELGGRIQLHPANRASLITPL